MKRERLTTAEVENNSPALLPLVDEMLEFRKLICKEVHEMFPEQNWTVRLNSAWELENLSQHQEVEDDSRPLEKEDNTDDLS